MTSENRLQRTRQPQCRLEAAGMIAKSPGVRSAKPNQPTTTRMMMKTPTKTMMKMMPIYPSMTCGATTMRPIRRRLSGPLPANTHRTIHPHRPPPTHPAHHPPNRPIHRPVVVRIRPAKKRHKTTSLAVLVNRTIDSDLVRDLAHDPDDQWSRRDIRLVERRARAVAIGRIATRHRRRTISVPTAHRRRPHVVDRAPALVRNTAKTVAVLDLIRVVNRRTVRLVRIRARDHDPDRPPTIGDVVNQHECRPSFPAQQQLRQFRLYFSLFANVRWLQPPWCGSWLLYAVQHSNFALHFT